MQNAEFEVNAVKPQLRSKVGADVGGDKAVIPWVWVRPRFLGRGLRPVAAQEEGCEPVQTAQEEGPHCSKRRVGGYG